MFQISKRALYFSAFVLAVLLSVEAFHLRAAAILRRSPECSIPDDSFVIYGVGESTAVGEPYDPEMEMVKLVKLELGGAAGKRKIVTVNIAQEGASIFPQATALYRALSCRNKDVPGVVLVYSGNNDSGYPVPVSALEKLEERVLYRSRLLTDAIFFIEKDLIYRFQLDRRFPTLRPSGLHWWEFNIRSITHMSLESGLVPIFSTVATNMADMSPAIDDVFYGAGISAPQALALIKTGRRLESQGRYGEAIKFYAAQEKRYPEERPFLEYRIGKCYERLGRYKLALSYFETVLNTPRMDNYGRATNPQNDYIRSLAKRYSLPLVDEVKIFSEHSPHGLMGMNLFSDGHHPNAEGYALLADAYSQAVARRFHVPIRRPFRNARNLFQAIGFSPAERLHSLLSSGCWLFSVSAHHYYPWYRLKMARAYFARATALSPRNFDAWMGLGLVDAAMHGDFLAEQNNIDFLSRYNLYYGSYQISERDLPAIVKHLRANGVPQNVLEKIRTTYR